MSRDFLSFAFIHFNIHLLISVEHCLQTTRLSTTTIMHLTKILSSIILAVTASAAPFVSPEVSLSKRQATSDGQAGAYISSPDGVAFTSVLGGKIRLEIFYDFLHPVIILPYSVLSAHPSSSTPYQGDGDSHSIQLGYRNVYHS
jgi:hypothetical protein